MPCQIRSTTKRKRPPTRRATFVSECFEPRDENKADPFFGLSRGWYYKAAAPGEIKMVAIRNRGAVRGVRLVAYDSVLDHVRRSMDGVTVKTDRLASAALVQ